MKQKTKLMLGDNIESLKKLPDNSIDSVVTDPPYGLSFMNKKWDYDVPSVQFWTEVYRVLKPGGHVLSFGGTRTYHRMVVNIEDAGFEIRDQIMWLYGSGFPKSHNIGKAVDKLEGNEREIVGERKADDITSGNMHANNKGQSTTIKITKGNSPYEGWGTALKPANEPICLARKPLSEKSVAENVLKWGTGGINVDGCRVGSETIQQRQYDRTPEHGGQYGNHSERVSNGVVTETEGRFPANIILECICDEVIKGEKGEVKKTTRDRKYDTGEERWTGLSTKKIEATDNYNDKGDIHTNPDCPCRLLDEQSGMSKSVLDKREFKPANEPICLARKPLSEKSVAENVLKWGTGGINVDGCRIEGAYGSGQNEIIEGEEPGVFTNYDRRKEGSTATSATGYKDKIMVSNPEGRFPANIILECICDEVIKGEKGEIKSVIGKVKNNGEVYGGGKGKNTSDYISHCISGDKGDIHTNPNCPCRLLDEQSGVSKSNCKAGVVEGKDANVFNDGEKKTSGHKKKVMVGDYNDKGGASRFFYQAKVSKAERNMGLDLVEGKEVVRQGLAGEKNNPVHKNSHPTVKPINLMTYLCRLITPQNGIILDPFMGSGSTGIAAQLEGFRFVGMEMDNDYFKIAESRINNYEKYKKFLK